jgi:hypothetical protein
MATEAEPGTGPSSEDVGKDGFFWGMMIVIGLFGIVMGSILTGREWLIHATASASEGWPTVPGRVLETRIDVSTSRTRTRTRTTYELRVVYEYTVDGQTYQADRVRAGGLRWHDDRGAALFAQLTYGVGTTVIVSYNPDDPGDAVLQPGAGDDNWKALVAVGVGLIGLSGVWTAGMITGWRRERAGSLPPGNRIVAAFKSWVR